LDSREQILKKVSQVSHRMRKNLLDMAYGVGAGSSHIGGGLSIVDITATLYGAVLNLDPKNPEWKDRDRFILSKGHGVLGYYTALAEVGYLSHEELMTFEKPGSDLFGHPVKYRKKGIEFSNGSLGMGLSLGIGVAVSGKMNHHDYRVFVLLGDGETNEGSVWEAALAGPHFKLDNLVAIIDRNNLQQTGAGVDIMNTGDIAAKWESFGWQVKKVDGHNIGELYDVFSRKNTSGKPLAVIANTIKGKGLSFAENNNSFHHAVLTKANYELAMSELEAEKVEIG
jgi:transketolase